MKLSLFVCCGVSCIADEMKKLAFEIEQRGNTATINTANRMLIEHKTAGSFRLRESETLFITLENLDIRIRGRVFDEYKSCSEVVFEKWQEELIKTRIFKRKG